MMSNVRDEIALLINQADALSSATRGEGEEYLALLDQYIERFSAMQQSLGDLTSLSPSEKGTMKELLTGLSEVHQQLIARTTSEKEVVHDQLLAIRKKVQGLRAYLDKLPQRITVAGKREG